MTKSEIKAEAERLAVEIRQELKPWDNEHPCLWQTRFDEQAARIIAASFHRLSDAKDREQEAALEELASRLEKFKLNLSPSVVAEQIRSLKHQPGGVKP